MGGDVYVDATRMLACLLPVVVAEVARPLQSAESIATTFATGNPRAMQDVAVRLCTKAFGSSEVKLALQGLNTVSIDRSDLKLFREVGARERGGVQRLRDLLAAKARAGSLPSFYSAPRLTRILRAASGSELLVLLCHIAFAALAAAHSRATHIDLRAPLAALEWLFPRPCLPADAHHDRATCTSTIDATATPDVAAQAPAAPSVHFATAPRVQFAVAPNARLASTPSAQSASAPSAQLAAAPSAQLTSAMVRVARAREAASVRALQHVLQTANAHEQELSGLGAEVSAKWAAVAAQVDALEQSAAGRKDARGSFLSQRSASYHPASSRPLTPATGGLHAPKAARVPSGHTGSSKPGQHRPARLTPLANAHRSKLANDSLQASGLLQTLDCALEECTELGTNLKAMGSPPRILDIGTLRREAQTARAALVHPHAHADSSAPHLSLPPVPAAADLPALVTWWAAACDSIVRSRAAQTPAPAPAVAPALGPAGIDASLCGNTQREASAGAQSDLDPRTSRAAATKYLATLEADLRARLSEQRTRQRTLAADLLLATARAAPSDSRALDNAASGAGNLDTPAPISAAIVASVLVDNAASCSLDTPPPILPAILPSALVSAPGTTLPSPGRLSLAAAARNLDSPATAMPVSGSANGTCDAALPTPSTPTAATAVLQQAFTSGQADQHSPVSAADPPPPPGLAASPGSVHRERVHVSCPLQSPLMRLQAVLHSADSRRGARAPSSKPLTSRYPAPPSSSAGSCAPSDSDSGDEATCAGTAAACPTQQALSAQRSQQLERSSSSTTGAEVRSRVAHTSQTSESSQHSSSSAVDAAVRSQVAQYQAALADAKLALSLGSFFSSPRPHAAQQQPGPRPHSAESCGSYPSPNSQASPTLATRHRSPAALGEVASLSPSRSSVAALNVRQRRLSAHVHTTPSPASRPTTPASNPQRNPNSASARCAQSPPPQMPSPPTFEHPTTSPITSPITSPTMSPTTSPGIEMSVRIGSAAKWRPATSPRHSVSSTPLSPLRALVHNNVATARTDTAVVGTLALGQAGGVKGTHGASPRGSVFARAGLHVDTVRHADSGAAHGGVVYGGASLAQGEVIGEEEQAEGSMRWRRLDLAGDEFDAVLLENFP